MKSNDRVIVILGVIILVLASIGIFYWDGGQKHSDIINIEEFFDANGIFSEKSEEVKGVSVSSGNPFFALIASPLVVNYDSDCNRVVKPLYAKDLDDTSKAISRAEEQIGIYPNVIIENDCSHGSSVKKISLDIAKEFWESSDASILIEDSNQGYNLGVVATPIASYLSIPVIVTDEIDEDVTKVLSDLGVEKTFVCGNLTSYGQSLKFDNVDEIVDASIELVNHKFGEVTYLTITNPQDTIEPEVLDTTTIDVMEGTVSSFCITPTNALNVIPSKRKPPLTEYHFFDIPKDYKYCRIKVDATHDPGENIGETGGKLSPMLLGPDSMMAYMFTVGGIPERDADGNILKDKIHWETIVYDQGGEEFGISVGAKLLTSKTTDYEVNVVLEKLSSPIEPRMSKLSSVAPYLTAYHKGIIFAKPEFAFAADEEKFPDISSENKGVVWPGSNPSLTSISNEHTFEIHEQINMVLAKIANIKDFEGDDDEDNLKLLKEHYDNDPMYIALVGSAEMVPQYYYYDLPESNTIFYGWDVASDFIYGNIDPNPRDDKIQDNHASDKFISKNSKGEVYEETYPHQENIVGRITGWDVQDASALILRTVFYEDIIENMDDDWKNTANVQTGAGTDFQRVPGFDLFRKLIGVKGDNLVMKWPTGESHFQNLNIQEAMKTGEFSEIISTENQYSGAYGLSKSTINEINKLGILNRLFFPKWHVLRKYNDEDIHGAEDQTRSNFIFSFGHGQPMGFGHADVLGDSVGFRPILLHNLINRITFATGIPGLGSGITDIGGYYVRTIEGLEYGPSVLFVESCYVGRIDAWYPKANAGQAFLHSGVNALIASSRGTPAPSTLDEKQRAVGFGVSEYLKTKRNPDLQGLHFSALYADNIFRNLGSKDATVGLAFREARNAQWEDADSKFFWAPPLDGQTEGNMKKLSNEGKLCLENKYTCQLEYNLFADPAFNPYEPSNNG